MLQLRHFPLSPFCRKVRLVLGEKKLACVLSTCKPWEQGIALQALPELLEPNGNKLCDARAIAEYLEETAKDPPLMPTSATSRANARRWVNFFDDQFWSSVTSIVLDERVLKRFDTERERQPDLALLKQAHRALRDRLGLVEMQLEREGALAGPLNLADLTAAAHFSCLDYFGDIPWKEFRLCHEWYARMKSRPSFRPLLTDCLPGFPPAEHYNDLDF